MKYSPVRDIPQAVRELKTLSPSRIREWIREHRTEKKAGKLCQCDVTPDSVRMWFKRHPQIYEELSKEIKEEELPKVAISETLYENGVFREVEDVKNWIRDLTNKGAKPELINSWVSGLKRVCQGIVRGRKHTREIIENWGLKHPHNLSLEDAKNFIFEIKQRGYRSREWRLLLRNFLTSKGVVVRSSDISGELEEDAGKYGDLFVPKDKIDAILAWLKAMNTHAYKASKFGYKTASRATATLSAHASYMNPEEHTITVFEKSVKGKGKRKMVKQIPDDLWEELPKEGKLFNITEQELNNLLKTAYKEIIPEIAERIPMPFHFWRHMFAQHMLRASDWNYGLVAALGGWSVEALRRYYGKPPKEVVREFGLKYLPRI